MPNYNEEKTPLLSRSENAESVHTKTSKVFLNCIEGLRFFATLTIIVGHTLDWQDIDPNSIDDAIQKGLSYVRLIFSDLQEVVSFWFLLAGFTLSWSCMDYNLEDSDQRTSFWKRRIARLYPDSILSCILLLFLAFFFFCSADIRYWMLNVISLLILPGSIPGWLPLNGSMWFIFVYFWLVIIFPFLLEPFKRFFTEDSALSFIFKILGLWSISLAPWILLSALGWCGITINDPFSGVLSWTLNLIPLMHLPEFCIGMAGAIRLHEDIRDQGDGPVPDALIPQDAAPYLALALSTVLTVLFFWRPYHFAGTYNSRLAPVHAALLYCVASVDCFSAAPPHPTEASNASSLAAHVRAFLAWPPLVLAAGWGLPALLFHKPRVVRLSLAAEAAGLGTFTTHCAPSAIYGTASVRIRMEYGAPLWFAPALAAAVSAAYLAGWLMSAGGPVGRHVHAGFDSLLGLRA